MRTTSNTMKFINLRCKSLGFQPAELLQRAKSLLGFYRRIVWSVKSRANDLRQEIPATYGMELNTSLAYLDNFSPIPARMDFSSVTALLYEARWLVNLADLSLKNVQQYPVYGDLYVELLHFRFMDQQKHTDGQTAEQLFLERSTYYERKKEATLLFGIALWGTVLPALQAAHLSAPNADMDEQFYFKKIAGAFS